MKPFALVAVVAALLAAGAVTYTFGGPAPAPATTQPTTKPAGKPVNKVCPVEKEDVDPDGPTVEYKGKVIGFCCKSCVKKFQADPEKYMKDLK